MGHLKPVRFHDGHAMMLAGLRRRHGYLEAPRGIPQQWAEFVAMLPLPNQLHAVTYGVMCGHDAESMEYLCGVEVSEFTSLAPDVGRMRVPAAHYAIFEHHGMVSDIRETWNAIYHHWLPNCGHASANTPDFERYDHRYDPQTNSGITEIWIPILPQNH